MKEGGTLPNRKKEKDNSNNFQEWDFPELEFIELPFQEYPFPQIDFEIWDFEVFEWDIELPQLDEKPPKLK